MNIYFSFFLSSNFIFIGFLLSILFLKCTKGFALSYFLIMTFGFTFFVSLGFDIIGVSLLPYVAVLIFIMPMVTWYMRACDIDYVDGEMDGLYFYCIIVLLSIYFSFNINKVLNSFLDVFQKLDWSLSLLIYFILFQIIVACFACCALIGEIKNIKLKRDSD